MLRGKGERIPRPWRALTATVPAPQRQAGRPTPSGKCFLTHGDNGRARLRWRLAPAQPSLAFRLSLGPARALETGQPFLVSSATLANLAASMPVAEAVQVSSMAVMAKPSPYFSTQANGILSLNLPATSFGKSATCFNDVLIRIVVNFFPRPSVITKWYPAGIFFARGPAKRAKIRSKSVA